MTTKRGFEPKTALTPEERLQAAYMHLIRGISQQDLADMFRVNIGRVNQAVAEARKTYGIG